ncbi:hypothetical protein HANVADRAFT_53380 [Hanseniaspora valbyensis NRRL Y-1626]|uniref:Uncharacterized protein n=1 Tax=Hanseniaspora valbyensis NRRL Y-1626 TaxID=766949 RepID=A0A1B7TBM9_9ASCO|nr:hypothetical protein HANVADRAFT_53380 [Hanseniaspora valbyensis NRRL Y-1626]
MLSRLNNKRLTSTISKNCPSCSSSVVITRQPQRFYSLNSYNDKEKAEEQIYVQKKEREALEAMKKKLEELQKEVEALKKSKKE